MLDPSNARTIWQAMTGRSDTYAKLIRGRTSLFRYLIKAGNGKKSGEITLKAMEIKQRFMRSIA